MKCVSCEHDLGNVKRNVKIRLRCKNCERVFIGKITTEGIFDGYYEPKQGKWLTVEG